MNEILNNYRIEIKIFKNFPVYNLCYFEKKDTWDKHNTIPNKTCKEYVKNILGSRFQ